MEAVITSIESVSETEIGGDTMYEVFTILKQGDKTGKAKCLAKTSNKWAAGEKVLVETTEQAHQGPDGESDWIYCKFKKADSAGKSYGGNKGGGNRSSGGGYQAKPIAYAEAASTYDDFLTASVTAVGPPMKLLLSNFGDVQPNADEILATATTLATARAALLFGAFLKGRKVEMGATAGANGATVTNGAAKPKGGAALFS